MICYNNDIHSHNNDLLLQVNIISHNYCLVSHIYESFDLLIMI